MTTTKTITPTTLALSAEHLADLHHALNQAREALFAAMERADLIENEEEHALFSDVENLLSVSQQRLHDATAPRDATPSENREAWFNAERDKCRAPVIAAIEACFEIACEDADDYEATYGTAVESCDAAGLPQHDADWQIARDDGTETEFRLAHEYAAYIALTANGYGDGIVHKDHCTLQECISAVNTEDHDGRGTWFEIYCTIACG
jgi:hypothetical protein